MLSFVAFSTIKMVSAGTGTSANAGPKMMPSSVVLLTHLEQRFQL